MIKIPLWEYQVKASEICCKYKRFLVRIDTGGGKTVVGLNIFDKLNTDKNIPRVVLCPKSAIDAWETDIKEVTDFSYSVDNYRDDVFINIITFRNVDSLFTRFRDKSPEGILIIDEVHMLCSPDSQQAESLRGKWTWSGEGDKSFQGLMSKFKNVYGLSATLMKNNLESIYYLVTSFFPGFWKSLDAFMEYYTIRVERSFEVYIPNIRKTVTKKYLEVTGFKNISHLSKMLEKVMFQHSINYGQKIITKFFELPDNEMNFYYRVGKGALGQSNKHFAARLPMLQKVVNGSVTEEGKFRNDPILSCKEQLLITFLNEIYDQGEGVLVFTQFKESTIRRFRIIKSHLKFKRFYFLTGETTKQGRSEIRHTLAPQECVFATKAGGVSLNFQSVNNVVFYDLPWDVLDFIQGMGRVTRKSSTYDTFNIYMLLAKDTIDEYKFQLTQCCLNLQDQIFGEKDFSKLFFTKIKKDTVIALRKSLLWGIKNKGRRVAVPSIKCDGCGRWTNTAVSDHISYKPGEVAIKCYAAFDVETQTWVKGCGFDDADEFSQHYVNKLIEGK